MGSSGDRHCGHLGVDWVGLDGFLGHPANRRCSFQVVLKKNDPFYCCVCEALVDKQQHKHDEADDNENRRNRNVGCVSACALRFRADTASKSVGMISLSPRKADTR
jgi:hypothetical protein